MAAVTTYNDKELFHLISDGDEAAFTELFQRYVPILEPFVFKLTKSAAAVDEVVQEAFLSLWLSRDKMAGIDNPRSWIFRIASNTGLNWLRRQTLEKKIFRNLGSMQETNSDATRLNVDEKQLFALVQEAVKQLPEQRRRIYRLSREQELSIPEIAQLLKLSASTVKNTLVSSLKFIREYLGDHGYQVSLLWLLSRLFFKNIFLD